MKKLTSASITFSLIAVIAITNGCATPSTSQGMTVLPSAVPGPINAKLKAAIVVGNITGGKETNPLWTSQVDNQTFKQALENSLNIYGYLAPSQQHAKYQLDAKLNSLDQPFIGVDFSVKSNVLYQLSGGGTERAYPITAIGTAKISESWIAMERLKLANEKSIQENIKELLQKLQTF